MVSHTSQLSHITLICKNIDKTGKFLKNIFGAVECYVTKKTVYSIAKERFFKIGELWVVTMEGNSITKTYNHIAFQVAAAKFPRLRQKIKKLGLEILPGRKRKKEEGKSMYFYDYDNHLFEIHSGNLSQRLAYYKTFDASSEKKI